MSNWLKQSTAITIKFGPFLDDTDGKTEETGLTISQADIRLSKNGGNIAQSNNAAGAPHDELGYYDVPLDTTDTNTLGTLKVMVHENGALPIWQEFMVVPANVWDSMFGADKLQVDLTQIGGDTQSGTDLKDFADAGYDPDTNKVEGVKTVDTTTTNSDMVGTDNAATASELSTHDGKLDTVDTVVDAIKAKTDNLPADPASETNVDANETKIDTIDTVVDAIKAKTDNLPADPASETNVDANETKIDTIDTVVDAIKAVTDNLPNSGALTDINSGVSRILGLSYENSYQHTRVYSGGKLNSAKLDLYDSKANAQTHDGSTGIVAKYTLTYTYSGDELTAMQVVRDS